MLPEMNRSSMNRVVKIFAPVLVIGLVAGLAVIIYNNAGSTAPKWMQTCLTANESDYKVEQSLNIFDLKLLRQILSRRDSNIILSSFSAASVLSMILLGVKKDTAKELHQLLTLPCNETQIESLYLSGLSGSFGQQQNDSGFSLEAANNIYVDNHLNLDPGFEEKTSKYFKSVPERLDFVNNAEASRNRINQWVEQKTKDKIQNLLPSGSVNSMTKMVLVNAIYFKGTWLHKFDKAANDSAVDFFLENGQAVKTSMMNVQANLMIGEIKDTMKIIKLPYIGDHVAMYIFSPMHDYTLKEALDIYDELDVQDDQLNSVEVELHVPKFSIESDYDLKPILQELGLKSLFSHDAAVDLTEDSMNLKVDLIVQKAFIDVNEDGTEAAAATGLTLRNLSLQIPQTKIILNRPFLFIIKNTLTGINLFSGCVLNPMLKKP